MRTMLHTIMSATDAHWKYNIEKFVRFKGTLIVFLATWGQQNQLKTTHLTYYLIMFWQTC